LEKRRQLRGLGTGLLYLGGEKHRERAATDLGVNDGLNYPAGVSSETKVLTC